MVRRAALGWMMTLALACASKGENDGGECPRCEQPLAATTPVADTASGPVAAIARTWREPAQAIVDLVDARPTPSAQIDPSGTAILLTHGRAMPPIEEVARPFARLAGMRIDERRAAQRRTRAADGLSVVSIASAEETWIDPPDGNALAAAGWSPDGSKLAWLELETDKVVLWTAGRDGSQRTRRGEVLDVMAPSHRWLPDGGLLAIVPHRPGPMPPATSAVPAGPVIEEANGERAQNRTWQDLLQNAQDELRFEWFATGQIVQLADDGTRTSIGAPGIFDSVAVSPDGAYILVERVRRPFSYAVPAELFGRVVEVWDRKGTVVATVADQDPAETIPIEGVRTGPRDVAWIPSEPATLVWVEATDDGDPRKPATERDRVMRATAPFAAPVELGRLRFRVRAVDPLADRSSALVTEYDRDRRWVTTWLFALEGGAKPVQLFDRSSRDDYGDPGRPVHTTLANGHRAVLVENDAIWLDADGASPKGERPFVARFDLATRTSAKIHESPEHEHVELVGFAGAPSKAAMVVRRESPTLPPNLELHEGDQSRALTRWPDPHPQLQGVGKRLLTYARADGVELSGTLYLPPGEPPKGGWPLFIWAYPLEYNDKDTAGQVRAAPNRFVRITGTSPLPLLVAGYAVLDDAAMPVVGDPETMNDTLLDQLRDAASAAIDAAAREAPIDRARVAVGGHSYGAFMTANLLAHTDLFRAGIARSGAYNRTLTPFGYQSERRTLWEARDTYSKVSPMLYADKIDEPILLVHGEVDDNSGTFPMQSQRLFSAIRGTGGTARLVLLPNEAHGYVARENVLQLLAEEIDWLDAHVKQAPK
ncbi:MAG TPA: prolyl oligopeptidase family serine peptidase [Nannocystaceae bacterium]|nr:prolyl oligopeptidase family serine peptidase [Nannocystaceae bacterium]